MSPRKLIVIDSIGLTFYNGVAKAPVMGGLVPAREMDTANPLEFGGDRKTIGKL